MENTGELEGDRDNREIKFIIGVVDRVEMDRINIQREDNENFSQIDENYQAKDSRNFIDSPSSMKRSPFLEYYGRSTEYQR